MTRTPAGTKILRVAIIQGGKIVEERHVRRPDSVSVGQDAKNTFVIPASNLPSSFPVFDFRGTHYYLLFTERMEGRVQLRGKDMDFAALRSQKVGQRFMYCFLSHVNHPGMRVPSARSTTFSGTNSTRLAISLSSFAANTSW